MNNKERQQPIFEYIAYGPTASLAADLIAQQGYPRPENMRELRETLKAFILDRGDEGAKELLRACHPDRDLFYSNEAPTRIQTAQSPVQQHSNCSGCAAMHSADGDPSTKTASQAITSGMQNMIFLGVFMFGIIGLVTISLVKKPA